MIQIYIIQKVLAGKYHSDTLSQLSRNIILQLIVSHQWTLNLGDIKGAFLEANVREWSLENPVYAELPPRQLISGSWQYFMESMMHLPTGIKSSMMAQFTWVFLVESLTAVCISAMVQVVNCKES